MSKDFMHVDPVRQLAFIDELNSRCDFMEKEIGVLESRMRMLGNDWRDDEYETFVRQCRITMKVLNAFIAEGRKVSKQLVEAADLAKAYQQIRQ